MNVALIGYGKMGHELEKQLQDRGHCIELIIDRDNAADLTAENLKTIDVAIEFSTPSSAFDNIVKCLKSGTPIVCGTTAWLDRYKEVVDVSDAHKIPFFYASNFSIGVNLFFKLSRSLAEMMDRFGQYDVTLNEVHHTQKLDAPSGTAVTLAQGIIENVARKESWHLGTTTLREQLEVTAQRRSTVVGQHTIVWESPHDSITIDHNAKSRAGFALGAIMAAEFLVTKSEGVYGMDDLLE